MGLDANGIRFLLEERARGVRFGRTLTIGRQGLGLSRAELARVLRRGGETAGEAELDAIVANTGHGRRGFAETLLERLGATSVQSLDYSDYEGAPLIWDLNEPIPEGRFGKFDLVIDGGTLEHVFNFPVALRNCMNLTAPGGQLVLLTIANNMLGHGFYQFSPELFYSVFCAANGFELQRMFIYEWLGETHSQWYAVMNPSGFGHRIELRNARQTFLLVSARRIADAPLTRLALQQSDYVATWEGNEAAHAMSHGEGGSMAQRLWSAVPEEVKIRLRPVVNALRPSFRPPMYQRYP